jgi:hypothetical protein
MQMLQFHCTMAGEIEIDVRPPYREALRSAAVETFQGMLP